MGVVYTEVLKAHVYIDLAKNVHYLELFVLKSDNTVAVCGYSFEDLVVMLNNKVL